MSEKKKKLPKAVSPVGTFQFPKLRVPDTKFNADGVYSVDLILEEDAADTFIKALHPAFEAAIAEGKAAYAELKPAQRAKHAFTANDFYSLEYDDTEQPTGRVIVRFKAAAAFTVKRKDAEPERVVRTIPVYDAKGNLIPPSVEIWGGTRGRVAFVYFPYFVNGTGAAGLSLRLDSVQVLSLRTRGESGFAGSGFDAEDGFVYERSDDTAADTTPDYAADGDQGGTAPAEVDPDDLAY